jgi:WD40 repeat protein
MTASVGPDDQYPTRVEVTGGQGVQVGDRNIQENKFIGQYVETQIIHPEPVRVTWPVRVGDVPQEPAAFQPRANLLAALGRSRQGTLGVQALTGTRGVGKTQLAAAYARSRMNEGWRLVAWVNADDTAAVLRGLGEVAVRLCLTDPGGDLKDAAVAVRNWLEADGKQCLLVLDNVTDLDGLRPLVPAAGDAQVVITSNLPGVGNFGQVVPVDVFTEDEALAFLAERTCSADPSGAPELAIELGRLPLALAQAAAVIMRMRLSYRTYLDRLQALPVSDHPIRTEGGPSPRRAAAAALLHLDSAGPRTLQIGQLVYAVALSPDGTLLAVGSYSRVSLWDLRTGDNVWKRRNGLPFDAARVHAVAFSPDGTRLATGSSDGTARIWDATTGHQQLQVAALHFGTVNAVAFSPDGTRLATGSGDKTARIWDATTGHQQLQVTHAVRMMYLRDVHSVAFSPDGTRLATGSGDKTARIWDTTTGQQQLQLTHAHAVFAVAFSPDGSRLATGGNDYHARIWNAETGQQQLRFTHVGGVRAVAFSPDGTRLATGSSDRTARIWDATARQLLKLSHAREVYAVAFSPGGIRLATGSFDKTARIWEIADQ